MNPPRASVERNLRLFPWVIALAWTPVFVAVIVLFWQENGLDLEEVFLLQGLFALSVALLEVPTGVVADRLGKRTSLLAGLAALATGLVAYACSSSFWAFFGSEVLTALGATLISGADSALLFDSLKALGREGEFRDRLGKAHAGQMVCFALCNIAGGLLGEWSLRSTLWASLPGPVLAFGFAWLMVEPNPGARARGTFKLFREALRFVLKHRLVGWYILFLAVLSASSTWLLWLYQPYMDATGFPVWAFGVVFCGYNLFAALCASQVARFSAVAGRWELVVLQVGAPLCMVLFFGPWGVVFVLGQQAVRGFSRSIVADRILRYTWANKRATVMSLAALGSRLLFAATAPFLGAVVKEGALHEGLWAQAAALGGALVVLAVLRRLVPAKYEEVKASVKARQ